MRIATINQSSFGSTGSIALGVHDALKQSGEESFVAWARGRSPQDATEYRFGTKFDVIMHGACARLTDKMGFYSTRATRDLVRQIESFRPDLVQLHHIHGYCINIEVLFGALARMGVPVVWTLHACWPFTGHCTYFSFAGCDKWKTHCAHCPQKGAFPKSIWKDNSFENFEVKRSLFTSLDTMVLVSPSAWLADLTRQSFLQDLPCHVIRNGIDRDVFHAGVDGDAALDRYGLRGKRVLLGVASPWSDRKGLSDFLRLRELLDESYAIVVVGLNEKQLKMLPEGIKGIARTDSAKELAQLYAAADLFVNPTHEDNYPTVNLESLACGTPVMTFDTGGSPECTADRDDCMIPAENTAEALAERIEGYFADGPHAAHAEVKSKQQCAYEYIDLYNSILRGCK